jgi:hypothetical protein
MSVEMGWDMIVWGDVTLRQMVEYTAIFVLLFIAVKVVRKLFSRKKTNLQNTVYFVCRNCDWEGHISKFGTRCPKCNHPID